MGHRHQFDICTSYGQTMTNFDTCDISK